jgi:phage terminase large subunit GpA-like protein
VTDEFASIQAIRREVVAVGLRPPPRLSLSEWSDEHFRLSAESAAQAGRWTCLPYQRGIMDSITDPAVTYVSLMKAARIGYTLMVSAAVGYYLHQQPCPILLVQPTVDDAKGFSKETIAPMLRDVPVLSQIIFEDAEESGTKDSGNTILHKRFPGGVLSMVGANSGAGFRRVSRKVVIFDEVDAYPSSAGSDGDPIKLGTKRAEFYWDRKIIAGSTPLVAGISRIERMFEDGDQRRYFVPCPDPDCGHMAYLVFSGDKGHAMKWPEGKPQDAFFACQRCGGVIEHSQKRWMIERGEWRAAKPFAGHASFHISALYSYSPNASWGDLAKEFLASKGNSETLRVFCNTVLGETFKEQGEAPDWERLYARRLPWPLGTVPEGVRFLTCGVDVQKDRFVYEVVGWDASKRSWSIEADVLNVGDTSDELAWLKLDELLNRSWTLPNRVEMAILTLAVDSGYNTQVVYNWARRHVGRVIAVKGDSRGSARTLIGASSPVDVTIRGKRIPRGCKVWPVGVDIAKAELYGWLRLPSPEEGQPYPAGWCHFPEHGPDYFKQLTAEHLVSVVDRKGFTQREWQLIPGRENHWLDARIYSRAAAAQAGIDRMRPEVAAQAVEPRREVVRVVEPTAPDAPAAAPAATPAPKRAISDSRFLRGKGNGGGWLSKKR